MKFGIVVLTLFTFASFTTAFVYNKDNCNENTSKCTLIEECDQLFKTVQELQKRIHKPVYTPEDKADVMVAHSQMSSFFELLRRQSCGFHQTMPLVPMVCCPLKEFEKYSSEDSPLITEHNKKQQCGAFLRRAFFGHKTDLSEYPWLALLEYNSWDGLGFQKKILCGGVLVSDRYVLTSSDCVNSEANKVASVILGEHNLLTAIDCIKDGDDHGSYQWCADAPMKIDVGRIIIERGLALIELKKQVKFSGYVQPICLPENEKFMMQPLEIAGWSKSMIYGETGVTEKLTEKVSQISNRECQAQVVFDPSRQICVGTFTQRACTADAGGPLMGYELKKDGSRRVTVVGVSAMHLSCPDLFNINLPGVFEDVHDYMQWIKMYVK